MFNWFKNRRRRKALAAPWPELWSQHLDRNVRLSRDLNDFEAGRLKQIVQIFVAEKHWEGCEGLSVTEEMKVTIAGQAALLLLGVGEFYFDNVESILIFPKAFLRKTHDGVIAKDQHRAGEAWQGGPIILSWRDTLSGGRNPDDGRNLVIHEFAHALDGLDGEMGGNVMFDDEATSARWRQVVDREYDELVRCKQQRISTLLDHYGATNQAEFFAVSCETFFEQPRKLKLQHEQLFDLLSIYFRVDPRRWQKN